MKPSSPAPIVPQQPAPTRQHRAQLALRKAEISRALDHTAGGECQVFSLFGLGLLLRRPLAPLFYVDSYRPGAHEAKV